MIKGGKGGAQTLTGLEFERKTNLRTAFAKQPGYEVKDNDLFYKGNLVAKMFKKYDIYKIFLKDLEIDWKSTTSARLVPDDSIFILKDKTLFIIEMKFQHGSGSVDEKLQTCDFKRKQYQKLVSGKGIKIEYVYILNNWFKEKRYKDVLEYIKSVDCHYFFEILPFDFLGLPKPETK